MKKKIACLLALCLALVMASAEMTENLDMSNLLNASAPVSQTETLNGLRIARYDKDGNPETVLINGHVLESGYTFIQNGQAGQEAILPTAQLQDAGFLSGLQGYAVGSSVFDYLNNTSNAILRDEQAFTNGNNADTRIDVYNEGAALYNATVSRLHVMAHRRGITFQNTALQGAPSMSRETDPSRICSPRMETGGS